MRVRLILGWLVVLSLVAAIGYAQQPPLPASPAAAVQPAPAQQPPARTLGLAEALEIARRNSPDYLATLNDRWGASRRALSSTARLITPTADVSASTYRAGTGQQTFGGATFPVTGLTRSSWNFSLGYQLSLGAIAERGLARAQLSATEEDVTGARTTLETGVRSQYLNVLQAQAQAQLAGRSLERVTENLNLARARYAVGQGTLIDVRRAEVDKGQAEVNVLKANQAVENEILRLFQRLGVPAPSPLAVQLTDSFPVVEPRFDLDQLMTQALAENPGLRSLRARENSARWNTRAARGQFLPSLNASAGYGRFRSRIDTTGAIAASGTSPWNILLSVSLPIYDGFNRLTQEANARAQEDDARQQVRSRELSVRSDVTAAYHALLAAYQTIALQQANKRASAEALDLATQRYRVGSGTYLELLDARLTADRADADYVTAVYDYHKAIATLENAVGRPLR